MTQPLNVTEVLRSACSCFTFSESTE